jgi:tRNA threonylcarbamoyladenosine biosynthesis protein TsaE
MRQSFLLRDRDDTKRIAEILGKRMRCGDVVTLAGDLGAGKTTFAQFLIQSLSANAVEVTSPTFTIVQTYPVMLADGQAVELYHYDLYRIEHPSALIELGFEDAVANLALIEWPERAASLNLPVTLALTFTLGENEARHLTIEGHDARWSDIAL